MLPGKMGHQNRVIVYHSRQLHRSKMRAEEKSEWRYPSTCITQRSLPCGHHSPTPFFHLNRITRAIRLELSLQLRQRGLRGSYSGWHTVASTLQ